MARVMGADATRAYNVPAIYQADIDPDPANHNFSNGYNIGDEWLNTTTGTYFKCIGNVAGAAIWSAGSSAETGPPGPPGPTGATGATGDVGPQGIPGPTEVSIDNGNLAQLGSDNLLLVPDTSVLKGVTDGSEARPGDIGEYLVTSNVTGVQMPTDVPIQICPISLTAGDWEIWGSVDFQPAGSQSPNMIAASVSVHPDTLPSEDDLMTGVGILNMFWTSSLTSGQRQVLMTGQCRSNSANSLDLYLIAQTSFQGSGNVFAKGYICARRVR
jgi:hypothetical protein